MKKLLLLCFFQFLCGSLLSQVKVSGRILDKETKKSVQLAQVKIKELDKDYKTDEIGYFQFKKVPDGEYSLWVSIKGYKTTTFKIQVQGQKIRKNFYLEKELENKENFEGVIELSQDFFDDQTDNDVNQASGALLQSSKDLFARTSAFEWGGYWFRNRGLDNKYQQVDFNGVRLNKADNGRVNWGNWGGLNDVTRHPKENLYGLEISPYEPTNVNGNISYTTSPSNQRKGTSLTYSATNRSYRNRIMASYNSGESPSGWNFSFSGARRWAEEGQIKGTHYENYAYYGSIEKKLGDKHRLNLVSFGSPYERSTNAPHTQEVYDLMGKDYNRFWGYQDGEKRNERVKKNFEPFTILTHNWEVSKKNQLQTSVAYQFGKNSSSRIERYTLPGTVINGELQDKQFTPNHSPDYYRNLPSNDLANDNLYGESGFPQGYYETYTNWKNGIGTQINWDNLYFENSQSPLGAAKYYMVEDINRDEVFTLNLQSQNKISNKLRVNANLNFQRTYSQNFREVSDLLGAQYAENLDSFNSVLNSDGTYVADANGKETYQPLNSLDTSTRKKTGDKIGYHFDSYHRTLGTYIMADYQTGNWDLKLSGQYANTQMHREGFFKHYIENTVGYDSFGESGKQEFNTFGFRTNLGYKINGRNHLRLNLDYHTDAPSFDEVFVDTRNSNLVTPEIDSRQVFASELTYYLRAPKIQAKASGFYYNIQNDLEVSRFFAEGNFDTLITEILTGAEKNHIGLELALSVKPISVLSLQMAASIGQYTYNNNPNMYTYDTDEGLRNMGKAFIKNYRVSNSAQQAYSLGIRYESPKYWWIGFTSNFLAQNYLDFSPLLRTNSFIAGVPESEAANVKDALKQVKNSDEWLFNLDVGKTFKVGNYYMGLIVGIDNIFNNRDYVTGGYEQSREAQYFPYQNDITRENPLFGPKLWYDRGRTYFINLFLRF